MLRCSLALLAFAFTGPLAASVCAAQLLASQELLSGDIETLDEYGYSVAVDGEWIAVGAISDDRNSQVDRGSVSMFRRAGTSWNFFTKLIPAAPGSVRRFGFSVDLEGDRLVVGTIGLNGLGPLAGGVYVYQFDGSSWTQSQLIRSTNLEQARSGSDVALSGDTLLDGAPIARLTSGPGGTGVVYVHVFDGTDWVLQSSLTANDASSGAGFGSSVALLGDLCAVGAPGANASYVFRRTGGVWTQEAKLVAPASNTGDLFGSAIALDGSNVAVGAPLEGGALFDSGSVYLFARSGAVWGLDEILTPANPLTGQQFGASLAMFGGRLYVGARNDSGIFGNAGSVFRFDDEFSGWTERTRFESEDLSGGDILGWSVDADSETLVAGARFDDSGAPDGGSAYAWADGCSVFTQVAQASYEVCLDLQLTDASASVSVPKFDPVLGSLSGVRFDLRSHFEASTSYENLSAVPATVDFLLDREMSVRRPGGAVILSEQNTAQEQVDLLAFDGVFDFLGRSAAELFKPRFGRCHLRDAPWIGSGSLHRGVGRS